MKGGGNSIGPDTARLLIAALCLAALVLVAVVLGGSENDQDAGRAIATALAFAIFSLPAWAGVVLVERRPSLSIVGVLTVIVSLVAFIAVVRAYWDGGVFSDDWKTAGELAIAAIGAGQVSMLLGFAPAAESRIVSLVRYCVVAAIAVVATLAIVEVSQPGRDVGVKPIAAGAIVYLFGTLLLPLLERAELGE